MLLSFGFYGCGILHLGIDTSFWGIVHPLPDEYLVFEGVEVGALSFLHITNSIPSYRSPSGLRNDLHNVSLGPHSHYAYPSTTFPRTRLHSNRSYGPIHVVCHPSIAHHIDRQFYRTWYPSPSSYPSPSRQYTPS